jgi:ApaG protein
LNVPVATHDKDHLQIFVCFECFTGQPSGFMALPSSSLELPGLTVVLDRLEYRTGGPQAPAETPHVFIYHLTIRNDSDRRVVLLGRKWIMEEPGRPRKVLEGDKIVGETPDLRPGESFSYNSFHLTAGPARAHGAFHGVDEGGQRVHVRIPEFEMAPPEED